MFIKRKHTRKLSYIPSVNWNNRLSSGLHSYYDMSYSFRDLAKKRGLSTAGTSQSVSIVSGEKSYYCNSDGLILDNAGSEFNVLNEFTVESRIFVPMAGLASTVTAGLAVAANASFQHAITCEVSSAEKIKFYMYNGSSGTNVTGLDPISLGSWHNLVWRRTYNAGGGGSISLFIDGKKDSVGDTTYTGTPDWKAGATASIMEYATSGGGYPDNLSHIRIWNRALNDAEIYRLNQNPYQLLTPRSIYIPDAVAAGIIYSRIIGSSVDAQDQQQAYEDKLRVLFNNLDVSDSLTRTVSTALIIERLLADTIEATDTIKQLALYCRNIESKLSIEDKLLILKENNRLLESSIDANDLLIISKELNRILESGTDINDLILRTLEIVPQIYVRLLNEGISVEDLINRTITIEGQVITSILFALIDQYNIEHGTKEFSIDMDTKKL